MHQYFKLEYYKFIDTASSKLGEIVTQEGAVTHGSLESCLLSGHMINDTCHMYSELDTDLLRMQLEMFRQQFTYDSVDAAADVLRSCVPEVRKLFSQVEILLRLLLVIPVTSCEADRSFSGLRRLKTWLRCTMTQERFNNLAVCNAHHDYIDRLDIQSVVNEFIAVNERRHQLFGNF